MSHSFEKGRHVFQHSSIIKPLGSRRSNRYATLSVTGVERGSGVQNTSRYFLFRALETSHCAGQLYYTIGWWMNSEVGVQTLTCNRDANHRSFAAWDQTGRQRGSWRSVLWMPAKLSEWATLDWKESDILSLLQRARESTGVWWYHITCTLP